jgi:hypothetical protein
VPPKNSLRIWRKLGTPVRFGCEAIVVFAAVLKAWEAGGSLDSLEFAFFGKRNVGLAEVFGALVRDRFAFDPVAIRGRFAFGSLLIRFRFAFFEPIGRKKIGAGHKGADSEILNISPFPRIPWRVYVARLSYILLRGDRVPLGRKLVFTQSARRIGKGERKSTELMRFSEARPASCSEYFSD